MIIRTTRSPFRPPLPADRSGEARCGEQIAALSIYGFRRLKNHLVGISKIAVVERRSARRHQSCSRCSSPTRKGLRSDADKPMERHRSLVLPGESCSRSCPQSCPRRCPPGWNGWAGARFDCSTASGKCSYKGSTRRLPATTLDTKSSRCPECPNKLPCMDLRGQRSGQLRHSFS